MDAAIESLVDLGFAKTTTLEVQKRAGVSRGALLYHFPSKAELLAATVVHLAVLRGRQLKELAVGLPGGKARVEAVLDLLWESFRGPLFQIATELRFAARTDAELRPVLVEVERDLLDRVNAQARRLFGDELAALPGYPVALEMTLQLMIGAATTAMLHGEHVRVEALINQWKTIFPTLLEGGVNGK
ncbi:MAG: TetR/AcrR family transcriptional regulator [Deltaproteobacteria bacterium]|nr:TetR/AcrR family transcriptional regulator [Deltaproteobacteria bacterium]